MWRIARGLYLGDQRAARDRGLLVSVGIAYVLNCAAEMPWKFRRDFRYYHLKLTDPDPSFHEYLDRFCKFNHRGRKAGGVLVHCRAGLSRSPSAMVAYFCWRGSTLEEALERLRRGVGEADGAFIKPDASFLEQIEIHFS